MSTGRPARVHVDVPGADVERLGRLLSQAVVAGSGAEPAQADVIVHSDAAVPADVDPAARLVTVPEGAAFAAGALEPWLASRIARALRRVEDPERHRSPGLSTLLTQGRYEHPGCAVAAAVTFGILLSKPGTVVTTEPLEDLEERIAECGYRVIRGRVVSADELRATGVVRRHYGAHWEIARAGRLQPEERLRLLAIYDRPGFEERFGLPAARVEVLPVLQYVERSGVDLGVINAWSESSAEAHGLSSGRFDGPNELGDLTYVNLFTPPDGSAPVFLLNPHMPSVTGWYEHSPTPLIALVLGTDDAHALPWRRMRAEFSGGSDPGTAVPGSLRRDMWEGVWPLRYADGAVGRARNGVHLSNGPVEAVREASIWFGIEPGDTATGRELTAACGGATDFMTAEYLRLGGRTRVLVDVTRDLSTGEAAALLHAGRRLSVREQAAGDATLRRLDLAHQVAHELARDDGVLAVLVGGSVATNRASTDSDLDVIVITSRPERAGTIERAVRAGVIVETEWLLREDALALAAGGDRDVRELRRSARLGQALPVIDPGDVAGELAVRARSAGPDPVSAGGRLVEAYATFVELSERPPTDRAACWAALRGIYDVIAFLLLLTSPLRYQKPKWVLADLIETGDADVAAELMRAYGVSGRPEDATRAVESAAGVVEDAAARLGLPPPETIRQLGLVAEFPEYSYLCHCLDDARSLLADERWPDAEYAAKFNVRMTAAMADGHEDPTAGPGRSGAAAFAHDVTEPPLDDAWLEVCLAHLERCRERLFGRAGAHAER